jgi:hypothetical protein
MSRSPLASSAVALDVVTITSSTVAGFKLVITFPGATSVPKNMPSRSC